MYYTVHFKIRESNKNRELLRVKNLAQLVQQANPLPSGAGI